MVISQILPISFTLNLAFLARTLDEGRPERSKRLKPIQRSVLPLLMVVSTFLFAIHRAPDFAGTPWLIPVVLGVRLLLILPYWLAPERQVKVAQTISAVAGLGLLCRDLLDMTAGQESISAVAKKLIQDVWTGHPAARVLSVDAVIAVISTLLYNIF